jgi:hypothetical protein
MIIGQYYRRNGGGAQFSPSFRRGGLAALFAVEIFVVDPSTTLTFAVEHKNISDTAWTTLVTMATLGAGVNTTTVGSIKEELRFSFVVNGTNAFDSVYANVLAPSWRPW